MPALPERLRPYRFPLIAAFACTLAALGGLATAKIVSPDDPAARVQRAATELRAALDAERAAAADRAKKALATAEIKDRKAQFDALAPLEAEGWGVAVVRDGALESWAGTLPEGISGWVLNGAAGVWDGSAYQYLWAQETAGGVRAIVVRALRPRVPLRPELRRPTFPAEAISEANGVELTWWGDGQRTDLGGGVQPILDPPGAEALKASAQRGPLTIARVAAGLALLLVIGMAAMAFLRGTGPGWARHLGLAAALWGARAIALALGIPGAFLEGPAFSPEAYATPALFDIARTAGELTITALIAALHLMLAGARGVPARLSLLSCAAPGGLAGFVWLHRAALTSTTQDSALDLFDPVSAIPGGAEAALWLALAAGSLALFLGARLAFLVAAAALDKPFGRAAKPVAFLLCAAAAFAVAPAPETALLVAWLALLLPARPSFPALAAGGAVAAALLASVVLEREHEVECHDDLVRLADRVVGMDDAEAANYANKAAKALEAQCPPRPEARQLLEIWASTSAAADGLPVGLAWTDGKDWWSFAVGMHEWNPASARPGPAAEPRPMPYGRMYFDTTTEIKLKDGARVRATVRVSADDLPTPIFRPRENHHQVVAMYSGGLSIGTWNRFAADLPPDLRGDVWREDRIAGEQYQILFRPGLGGESPEAWAFARRLESLDEYAVGGLRALFLFALAGAVFGVVGALIALATGALPRGWSRRFEFRLTLSLVLVSAIPAAALGFLARSLALGPLELLDRLNQESAEVVLNGILEAKGASADSVRDETLASFEKVSGRDLFYYYNGRLRALGQPALGALEIAPGHVPAPTWQRISGPGRRFHSALEPVGEAGYRVRWIRSSRSTKAIVALPSLPDDGADAGRAASLALGAATLVALIFWPVSALLARRVSRPVGELTTAAGKVEAGDLTVRVNAPAPGDIADLIVAFNRMTEGLERGRDALARAERERAWREMARQVAHEIKNPLTPLKLSLQNLRAAWQAKDPGFGEQLEEAVTLTIRQIEILARIATDFSQFAGKPHRTIVPLDLNPLLRETVELYRPTAVGVEFAEELEPGLPRVAGDRAELLRAFANLVKNGIQAMPTGGRLTVGTQTREKNVEVIVADTGVGIPAELKERMFEPYFSTKTEGTGLGLGIVRRTVEDMNGTVEFESAVGKGTRMILRFPAERA